jgi:hypothetical protein
MHDAFPTNSKFVVEDETHAECCGTFSTFAEAMSELQSRSRVAWDAHPNVCPCTNWKTCGREYSIVEFDISTEPWRERSRTPVLAISSSGVEWNVTK